MVNKQKAKAVKKGQEHFELNTQHVLKFDSLDYFTGRVNQNSRQNMIVNISKCLSCEDWERLMHSQFGSIAKMAMNHSFSSQLAHYILFRQVDTTKKWETWYDLQGKLLRFSMKEFAIVTGLNCGNYESHHLDEDKLVVKRIFGVQNINMAELENTFYQAGKEDPFKLKMAMLLILESVVLGVEKNVQISTAHIRLLDDIDRFKSFPWGRISYMKTHTSLENALKQRLKTVKESKDTSGRNGYKIDGMSLAFQLWLFEAVPLIASMYAQSENVKAYPRCLRWSSRKNNHDHQFLKSLLDEDPLSSTKLEAKVTLIEEDETEATMLQEAKFEEEVSDQYFDKIVAEFEKGKKKSINRKKVKVASGAKVDNLDSRQVMCAINDIVERLDRLESKVELGLNKMELGLCAIKKALGIKDEEEKDEEEMDEEHISEANTEKEDEDEKNSEKDKEEEKNVEEENFVEVGHNDGDGFEGCYEIVPFQGVEEEAIEKEVVEEDILEVKGKGKGKIRSKKCGVESKRKISLSNPKKHITILYYENYNNYYKSNKHFSETGRRGTHTRRGGGGGGASS